MLRFWFLPIISSCLAAGCADEPPPDTPEPDRCWEGTVVDCSASSGSSHLFAIRVFDVARSGGVQDGLDLDCTVSDRADDATCNQRDFSSPDGRVGIDNQLGYLLTTFDFQIGASVRREIAEGSWLRAFEVSGVDDLVNDDCVRVSMIQLRLPAAVATPAIDVDGLLSSDQAFELYEATRDTTTAAHVEGGQLIARFDELPFWVPTVDLPLAATMRRAVLVATMSPRGLAGGLLGGFVDVDDAVRAAVESDPTAVMPDLARNLVDSLADASRDSTGSCREISVGLSFDAVVAEVAAP